MKKILIFGLPRSGTTVLQKRLGRSLRIQGYNEPFTFLEYQQQIGDPYQWVSKLSCAAIKVLAHNLDHIDLIKLINAGKFDSIIVTKRNNLTDCCVSLYYAQEVAKNYHYSVKPEVIMPFTVTIDFVNNFFLLFYAQYLNVIKQLDDHAIPYTVFDYDQYQLGKSQIIHGIEFCLDKESSYKIDTISTNIDYSRMCVNYNEIDSIIKNANHY